MPRRARSALTAAVLAATLAAPAAGAVTSQQQASRVTSAGAAHSFITRHGTHLQLAGHRYRFTGLNIYNANSRDNCWYSLGDGTGLQRSLHQIGAAQNVFRAWFFQSEATVNGKRDWSAFDHTLAAAKAAGDRVIPVLLNQWGDCEGWSDYATGYKTQHWYARGYKTRPTSPGMPDTYRAWVRHVVHRYRNNPTILAWQMVNEAEDKKSYDGACSSTAAHTLKHFAGDISTLITSIDPNHLVSIGTIGSGQCGSAGSAYTSLYSLPHVDMCEYHDYSTDAMPGDQWNGLAARIAECTALHKPLFIGEAGIKTSTDTTAAQRSALVARKMRVQFAAGVAGMLLWDWRDAAHGGSSDSGYEIGPGDPVLSVLATR